MFPRILSVVALVAAPLLATAPLTLSLPSTAVAQVANDAVILDMNQAFRRNDKARLSALLPQAMGHPLETWAAYWELKARLNEASSDEIQGFLRRYAGTYVEDRLRNDWLLQLADRGDWATFDAEYPRFRMNDDRTVRCHALLSELMRTGAASATPALVGEVKQLWYDLRDKDESCGRAAAQLYGAQKLSAADIWREARLNLEANRPSAARAAVQIVAPEAMATVAEIQASPIRFLATRASGLGANRSELTTLALTKLANVDPDQAALQMERFGDGLTHEERNWAWGAVGRQAAQKFNDNAASYYAKVNRQADLPDDMLAWEVRAALRRSDWRMVLAATGAMSPTSQADAGTKYWRARALLAPLNAQERAAFSADQLIGGRHAAAANEARQLLQSIASERGFYEMLALEELGGRIGVPAAPAPLSPAERNAARANPHLQRALYAIGMGLRSEGVREWNYATNLHQRGGLGERELLAAAELACERQIWDRCINTSERTKTAFDAAQRFPTPLRDVVVRQSQGIGLDPAYVYGLIRQESRFVTEARSGVGASGLMQVMPATARWTARKIGLAGFTVDQLNDRETNVMIGTHYLKLALDDFDNSMPMAAAAYNAGPGRPRNWRNGPTLEGAAWAETIPFGETRDYVKKVLANTTLYAALLTGQPQSLKSRLGTVGPRPASDAPINADLP